MIPKLHIVRDELAPGSTLGKYEVLRKLATGGMAELYLARARGVAGFEKTVVLKRILPHVAADESFVQMFLDEARLAATLQHPNIADVYDVGEADGTPFFAMEYVHGQDVRSIRAATRRRNEQIPTAMALAIIHGTAAALDYAHGRAGPDGRPLELVHRDVSSSNVIVSYDGAIKLLDFGIARAASHQHKTQVGTLKGKTPYMSPEQCRAQRLDRRSDLFSLGTVMFELTVGRRPFRGESEFAIMEQIVHGEAPRPSALAPGYPEELEAIVLRLLARRVEDRYQTAEEMLHDLEGFISKHGLWVSSRPLGKYMRLLFADRIDAWERAADEGVSLGDHVAETITSESQRAELETPRSEAPRLLRLSQEIPAVGLPSMQMAAVQPPPDEPQAAQAAAVQVPAMQALAGQAPVYANLQPRAPAGAQAADAAPEPAVFGDSQPTAFERPSYLALPGAGAGAEPGALASAAADADASFQLRPARRGAALLGGLLLAGVIIAGIYAWPRLFPKPAPAAETAADTADTAKPAADTAKPAADTAAAAKPAADTAKPAAETAKIAEPAAPAPDAAATKPAPPAPETATAKAGAAPTGAATKRAPAPRAPARAPARVPSPRTPSKDNAWDRDSPFLPPSN